MGRQIVHDYTRANYQETKMLQPSTAYSAGSSLESGLTQPSRPQNPLSYFTITFSNLGRSLFSSSTGEPDDASNRTLDIPSLLRGPFAFDVDKLLQVEADGPSESLKRRCHQVSFFRTSFDILGGLEHSICDLCFESAIKEESDRNLISTINQKSKEHDVGFLAVDDVLKMTKMFLRSGVVRVVDDELSCIHSKMIGLHPGNYFCSYEMSNIKGSGLPEVKLVDFELETLLVEDSRLSSRSRFGPKKLV
jgi:hypothetical protein